MMLGCRDLHNSNIHAGLVMVLSALAPTLKEKLAFLLTGLYPGMQRCLAETSTRKSIGPDHLNGYYASPV